MDDVAKDNLVGVMKTQFRALVASRSKMAEHDKRIAALQDELDNINATRGLEQAVYDGTIKGVVELVKLTDVEVGDTPQTVGEFFEYNQTAMTGTPGYTVSMNLIELLVEDDDIPDVI